MYAPPIPVNTAKRVYHTVRSGETLTSIARRYGVAARGPQALESRHALSPPAGASRSRCGRRLSAKAASSANAGTHASRENRPPPSRRRPFRPCLALNRSSAPRPAAAGCTRAAGERSTRSTGTALHDPPLVHHRDFVREVVDDRDVVGDEEVGEAAPALQRAQQVQDLRLHRDVERAGRLVADDQLRVDRQRACDGDALPLTARELVRVAPERLGRQPDLGEQRLDTLRFSRRRPRRPRGCACPRAGSRRRACAG